MDSLWIPLIIASAAVYSWKILGFALPARIAKNKSIVVLATKLTIALLSALVAVETLTSGQHIVLDSRIPALGVAAFLYWRKAPFLVAVATAAGVAALLRFWLGWA